jgi:hypothetical protein
VRPCEQKDHQSTDVCYRLLRLGRIVLQCRRNWALGGGRQFQTGKRCALTILMVVICGVPAERLSAQDCGFFWPCQRPAEPRLVPAPGAPPEAEYYRQPAQPGRRDNPEQQSSQVNPIYLRQTVHYPSNEAPGTIVVDPHNRFSTG